LSVISQLRQQMFLLKYRRVRSFLKYIRLGYVFYKCRIDGDAIVPVYLGRPWRPYGRCAYIKCHIGRVVSPPGWDNWRDPSNEKKCCFGEYHNTGAGSVSAGNIRAFGSQLERRYVHALVALFKNYK
jgi:pectinesterase